MQIEVYGERVPLSHWENSNGTVCIWVNAPLTEEQVEALSGAALTVYTDEGGDSGMTLPEIKTVESVGYVCTIKTQSEKDAEALQARAEVADAERDRLQEEKTAILAVAAAAFTDEQAKAHPDIWEAWQADKDYNAGLVLMQKGVLYRVEQAHTSKAHQPPDGAGMLAIYRPIQTASEGGGMLPWVSGEAGVQKGDKRSFGGKVYEAVQSPGVNIWEPPTVGAIWKEVK